MAERRARDLSGRLGRRGPGQEAARARRGRRGRPGAARSRAAAGAARTCTHCARDALAWLDAHGADRFFLFVNFNSPHEPYDPVPELLARIPKAPGGVALEPEVRSYMAEGAKDDAATASAA